MVAETKWCGPGNKAKNFDDLGYFNITDACCREHDFCPESIKAFRKKYDLWNASIFLRFFFFFLSLLFNSIRTFSPIFFFFPLTRR